MKARVKKSLLLLVIGIISPYTQAQALLSAVMVNLDDSKGLTLLAAPEAGNNKMVVFAADDKSVTAIAYNSNLSDIGLLKAARTGKEYKVLAGYGFCKDTAYAYWVPDHQDNTFLSQAFDFSGKTVTSTRLKLPVKHRKIIQSFSTNNSRYVLATHKNKNKLDLCVIKGNTIEKHTLDFSGIKIRNHISGKAMAIKKALKYFPLQEVYAGFTSLPDASPLTKMYVLNDTLVITMDHYRKATQAIRISLKDYSVSSKIFEQPFNGSANTASFYNNGVLYQLAITKNELRLQAADFETGKLLNTYTATENDSISFAYSGLKEQTGDGSPHTLYTKKFLYRASRGNAAISVYRLKNNILINAGGVRYIKPGFNIVMGAVVTMAGGEPSDFALDEKEQQVHYFESLFDTHFNYLHQEPGLLATDHISNYISSNGITGKNTVAPFASSHVLVFYDAETKSIVLRRFEDDD